MKGSKVLKLLFLVGVLTLALGAGQAMAQSIQFQVSATVGRYCSIDATALGFGGYNPLDTAPVLANSTISIRCTRGTTAYIALNDGTHGARQMDAGTGLTLGYELFQDNARLVAWGTGAARYQYSATNSASHDIPVYGRVPAAQDVPEGNYTDTVTATIEF